MGKINVLDSTIFNRIAAGEVVERPASVVKELVENSLDAKATQIRVEIIDGGKRQIKVSDNGVGIEPSDVATAFLPHATSKIHSIDDLDKIGTLGFRGEALASIASVSQVELTSKVKANQTGQRIKIEGGQILENTEVASPDGTFITVNNLFYNVPARQKFLKGDKKEETEITNLMARFILANPEIVFIYVANKKEIYRSTGKNLEEAVFTVYGKTTLENLIPFEHKSGDITLKGYLGKPTYAKNNRTYQTLIINGRYVINSLISTACYKAYENYLMKRKFPFFVIHMNLPLDKLDVNVHPNKLDVKFENTQNIYGIIYNAVTNTLMNASNILKLDSVEETPSFSPINVTEKTSGFSFASQNNTPEVELKPVASQNEVNKEASEIEKKKELLSSVLNFSEEVEGSALQENTSVLTSAYNKEFNNISSLKQENKPMTQTQLFENSQKDTSDLILIGKVFQTFVLVQRDESMFVIDQHAAHERFLYDKLTKQVNEKAVTIQTLLVPHILTVNHLEEAFLNDNLDEIKKLGFDIESFGGLSFKISSIPSVLSGMNLDIFFNDILKDMTSLKNKKTSDLITDKLKMASCKAAVKAGDNLSKLEILTLLDEMKRTNMTLLCPHGRPIVVEVTRKEMDKWFKRIV